MIGILVLQLAMAECPKEANPTKLNELLESSYQSIQQIDVERFEQSRGEVLGLLPCVDFVLTVEQIAKIHQVQAMYHFIERDLAAMSVSIQAAYRVDPNSKLPVQLFPEEHLIHSYISLAQSMYASPTSSISRPFSGSIYIDGNGSLDIPTMQPYMFQHLDGENKVVATNLMGIGKHPEYKRWNDKRSVDLTLQPHFVYGAGGAALLSVGFGVWSMSTESKFWNIETERSELDSLRTQTNVLSGLTVGLGMVSIGLLTTSIITGEW